MCRCLEVSTSGLHAWRKRSTRRRELDEQRLPVRIGQLHAGSDGVMGMHRVHEEFGYDGETASPNRIARLMASDDLYGVPQRRRWRRKRTGVRPSTVRNHLERDFEALEPNTKWVTDIAYIRTAQGWLYLCVVLDLYSKRMVGCSMYDIPNRQMVLKAVLMAFWQRPNKNPVVLHSHRGTRFTSSEYQQSFRVTTSCAA